MSPCTKVTSPASLGPKLWAPSTAISGSLSKHGQAWRSQVTRVGSCQQTDDNVYGSGQLLVLRNGGEFLQTSFPTLIIKIITPTTNNVCAFALCTFSCITLSDVRSDLRTPKIREALWPGLGHCVAGGTWSEPDSAPQVQRPSGTDCPSSLQVQPPAASLLGYLKVTYPSQVCFCKRPSGASLSVVRALSTSRRADGPSVRGAGWLLNALERFMKNYHGFIYKALLCGSQ